MVENKIITKGFRGEAIHMIHDIFAENFLTKYSGTVLKLKIIDNKKDDNFLRYFHKFWEAT